jgi:hypothetical protein
VAKEYLVVLAEDEDSCAVKKVSENTYYQVKDMIDEGDDDLHIIESMVELNTTEDNFLANGLSKDEAIEFAEDITHNYVVIEAY